MRRAALIVLALTVSACDQDPDEQIRGDVAAMPIASCADLETEIERRAIREMNAEIDQILAYLDRSGGVSGPDFAVPSAQPTSGRSGPTDFTTTNTQERDVDEPDFVKNDGSRIFVLNGRSLVVLAAWPPENARLESVTPLEGQPAEMFLQGNRLAVYSRASSPYPIPVDTRVGPSFVPPAETFSLTVFDVSGAAPFPVYRHDFDGRYVSARRTGNVLRTVSVAPRRGPTLVYWPDANIDWNRPDAVRIALEKARAQNVNRIRAASLDDWLPRSSENGNPVPRECGSFYATNVSARLGFTTVTTLDLSRLESRRSTLLNEADEVYASKDRLYLATRHTWMTPPGAAQVRQNHTYVFQFDTASDPRGVRYVAGGGVAGHIADQFSLDEEDGYLRVATTRETWLGWAQRDLTNNVFVLRAGDGRLQVVGEVSGLARDERIYSARFDGDRGFVVTFRQVDPLFTLNLSNPRNPQVAGELKIPGFSTYLHPLDRDHLLAIGREVSADGRVRGGVQLQVFDVTNFANPAVQHRYTIGTGASSSEAEYDHKAFTLFASRGLLGIPFSDWSAPRQGRFRSTLEVLRVSLAGGIAPVGSIDHSDLVAGTEGRYANWTPQIRRSVMMDDFVYAVSYGGLTVHDTRDLSRSVATIPFPVE